MGPWGISRSPVVADYYLFDGEQDPDPHQSEKSHPDPHHWINIGSGTGTGTASKGKQRPGSATLVCRLENSSGSFSNFKPNLYPDRIEYWWGIGFLCSLNRCRSWSAGPRKCGRRDGISPPRTPCPRRSYSPPKKQQIGWKICIAWNLRLDI
jgi:hypothetical protein